jgi:hypothetical protein
VFLIILIVGAVLIGGALVVLYVVKKKLAHKSITQIIQSPDGRIQSRVSQIELKDCPIESDKTSVNNFDARCFKLGSDQNINFEAMDHKALGMVPIPEKTLPTQSAEEGGELSFVGDSFRSLPESQESERPPISDERSQRQPQVVREPDPEPGLGLGFILSHKDEVDELTEIKNIFSLENKTPLVNIDSPPPNNEKSDEESPVRAAEQKELKLETGPRLSLTATPRVNKSSYFSYFAPSTDPKMLGSGSKNNLFNGQQQFLKEKMFINIKTRISIETSPHKDAK